MTKIICLFALGIFLASCASWHCKRCQKLGGIKTDTTSQIMPVPVPGVKADTTAESNFGKLNVPTPCGPQVIDVDSLYNAQPDLFENFLPKDSIEINKGNLAVKVTRKGRKTNVQAECKPDTLKVEVPVLIENKIETGISPLRHWATVIGAVLLTLLACGLLFRVAKR